MVKRLKPDPKCSKCRGKGSYYTQLPDDVGSPNPVKCDCVKPQSLGNVGLRERMAEEIYHFVHRGKTHMPWAELPHRWGKKSYYEFADKLYSTFFRKEIEEAEKAYDEGRIYSRYYEEKVRALLRQFSLCMREVRKQERTRLEKRMHTETTADGLRKFRWIFEEDWQALI